MRLCGIWVVQKCVVIRVYCDRSHFAYHSSAASGVLAHCAHTHFTNHSAATVALAGCALHGMTAEMEKTFLPCGHWRLHAMMPQPCPSAACTDGGCKKTKRMQYSSAAPVGNELSVQKITDAMDVLPPGWTVGDFLEELPRVLNTTLGTSDNFDDSNSTRTVPQVPPTVDRGGHQSLPDADFTSSCPWKHCRAATLVGSVALSSTCKPQTRILI